MDDAAIHRVWGTRAGLSVRLLRASGSPRPQGARDDKVEGAGRLVGYSGSPRAYALAMTRLVGFVKSEW